MDGSLRNDLYDWLTEISCAADLVLVVGTSLSGMNADQVVTDCSERSRSKPPSAIGSVIINLQRTPLDASSTLRIFAHADKAMGLLAAQLSLSTCGPQKMISTDGESPRYSMVIPPARMVEPHVYLISFGSDGNRLPVGSPLSTLDLREGRYVRITHGMFQGDYGEVLTPNRQGHYRIIFRHTINKHTGNKVPMQRVLGCWWLELGCTEGENDNRIKFPIASCSEEEAKQLL